MYYAAAVKDPTVVAHLSKQQPQQRNNKSTSTTTIHPYSSVSLSPCRNYAIAACKSDVQIVKVDPTGLHHLRTVSCNPYFVMAAAHKKKQHNHQDGGANGYEESLNLREFAFGGMGGGPNNPPPPASSSSASVSASMMNVVITDVAWSPWSTISVVEDMPGSSADGTLGDTTHHHSFPSTTNIHQNNPTTNNKDNNNSQNHHGLIAAAGSNGTIVVWNASALLNIPQSSFSGQQQQQQHNPIQHAPEAVLSLHVRAVNRLAWHPQRAMLLSASQDGTVLLWERKLQPIRTKDSVSKSREKKEASLGKFRGLFGPMGSSAPLQPQQSYDWFCRATFAPKSEAVRDICWSPFYEDGTCIGIFQAIVRPSHSSFLVLLSLFFVFVKISVRACDNQWVFDHIQSKCLCSRIGEDECPLGGCYNFGFSSHQTQHYRHWLERSIGESMGFGIGFDFWSER
jgi:WD40 repeat protein